MQAHAEWTTTTTHSALAARMLKAQSIAIVAHQRPDGDAIGSTLSVARTLAHTAPNIKVTLIYVGSMPLWADSMLGDQQWTHIADEGTVDLGKLPELCVVFDTGTRQQIGKDIIAWIEGDPSRIAIVDHHQQGDPELADDRIVETDAAAVCEVAAKICCALAGVSSCASLPVQAATPLYLGCATDTGWFKYSSVTSRTMRLAGDLLDAGVDHANLFDVIESQDRISRYQLMGRSFTTLQHEYDGQVVVQQITADDFVQTHAQESELNGFSAIPLAIHGTRVSVFLTQSPKKPHMTKVSLRSKPGRGAVDVSVVASSLGGGGHARAAGVRLEMPIDQARTTVLEALKPHLAATKDCAHA